jgi:hypothetical protein
MKPSENQQVMKNLSKFTTVSPSTTNWDRMGFYKNLPANTETVRKAGAVYVVLPGGKRVLARTSEERRILRRSVNSLRAPKPVVEVKKVTYRVRLVKARIKTLSGKVLNRICKVTGSDGVKKVFVTKKAALAWVKSVSK